MHRLVTNMNAGMALLRGCCRPSPPCRTAIVHMCVTWEGREVRPVMLQMKEDTKFSKDVVMGLSNQYHLSGRSESGRQ